MKIYRKPHHGYNKKIWEGAKADPAIIYFTTSFLSIRPWFESSNTSWTEKWREYYLKSEWENDSLRKLVDRSLHDRIVRFFNLVPRKLAVGIAGVLHTYVKTAVLL